MKQYLITGDTHGKVCERLEVLKQLGLKPFTTSIIILGDAGLNFYLNKTDENNKRKVNDYGYLVYCVRGNHEERPENIPSMHLEYDDEVYNFVYIENNYPNIRYLIDGGVYSFGDYSTLVIGGAYSVDKYYRLARAENPDKWSGWFKDEQLTTEEMERIAKDLYGESFDLVLSHTCPYSWQPFDLFINGVNQERIDKSMELWLESFKDIIDWKVWMFGHFHDDRDIIPGVRMLYTSIEDLDTTYSKLSAQEKGEG